MVLIVKICAYLGVDWKSRLTLRVLRDLQFYMAHYYGLKVIVDTIEVPVGDSDNIELIPLVIIDGDVVSRGEVPSMSTLVDIIFDKLSLKIEKTILGFPVLEATIDDSN